VNIKSFGVTFMDWIIWFLFAYCLAVTLTYVFWYHHNYQIFSSISVTELILVWLVLSIFFTVCARVVCWLWQLRRRENDEGPG
jgi:H+/Cl- antiporter ClcA